MALYAEVELCLDLPSKLYRCAEYSSCIIGLSPYIVEFKLKLSLTRLGSASDETAPGAV